MADKQKIRELQAKVMQDIAAGALIPIMRIGDELGLFEKLFNFGPSTYKEFSQKTNLDERYLKEWLLALSAAKYISYNKINKSFYLTEEQFSVLGDESSSSLMIGGFENLTGAVHNIDKIKENFKNGMGTEWGSLHPCCLSGSARFFKPAYSIFLIKKWIPSLDRAEKILLDGGKFADIGCGHGYSTSIIAETYQNSHVMGVDPHKPSIDEAKKLSSSKNLKNVEFQVASSTNFEGNYDIIAFFDCLHDMGDPISALKHARKRLNNNGLVMIVEPTSNDDVVENFNLIGQMYYSFSTIACIPASKSQEVGLALGAQAGPSKLIEILKESGFKNANVTYKTASNMVIQATK
tara:strand:- start:152 stop:1201 length:1050 start_codon:yes stop_codon:yes gene_type:complete